MQARSLFARMTTIKANAKKMKIIFKKYLEFEMKYGTVELQENVKEKVKDYVSSLV
jgi:rRNA biogenesis protein RRP5